MLKNAKREVLIGALAVLGWQPASDSHRPAGKAVKDMVNTGARGWLWRLDVEWHYDTLDDPERMTPDSWDSYSLEDLRAAYRAVELLEARRGDTDT